jgi:hypothetical protein
MPVVTRIRNTVPVTCQYQLRLERVIRRVDCNARIKREQRVHYSGQRQHELRDPHGNSWRAGPTNAQMPRSHEVSPPCGRAA